MNIEIITKEYIQIGNTEQSLNILLFEHLYNKMFYDSVKQKFEWLWADYSLLKHSESQIRKSKKAYFTPKIFFFDKTLHIAESI